MRCVEKENGSWNKADIKISSVHWDSINIHAIYGSHFSQFCRRFVHLKQETIHIETHKVELVIYDLRVLRQSFIRYHNLKSICSLLHFNGPEFSDQLSQTIKIKIPEPNGDCK